jgi:hypothetical protein
VLKPPLLPNFFFPIPQGWKNPLPAVAGVFPPRRSVAGNVLSGTGRGAMTLGEASALSTDGIPGISGEDGGHTQGPEPTNIPLQA